MDALSKIQLGSERRIVVAPEERRRTAYREAGRALLGMLTPGADPVRAISIVPRGHALGVTFQSPDTDRYSYSEPYSRPHRWHARRPRRRADHLRRRRQLARRATLSRPPLSRGRWSVAGACRDRYGPMSVLPNPRREQSTEPKRQRRLASHP